MTIIAEVVKDINNLIDKSEYYIDKAIEWKEQYPQLSKIYYDTYMDSINKIMAFHSQVVNFIAVLTSSRLLRKINSNIVGLGEPKHIRLWR